MIVAVVCVWLGALATHRLRVGSSPSYSGRVVFEADERGIKV
jgi:hypothetical protein